MMSVASAALSVAEPYAFIAPETARPMSDTSPSPAADALPAAPSASIASLPRRPAEVMTNRPSDSSVALLPVVLERSSTPLPIAWTSFCEMPTRPVILDIDDSKSEDILKAAAPIPTMGSVTPMVILRPTLCILSAVFLNPVAATPAFPKALTREVASPTIATSTFRVPRAITSPPSTFS